MLFEAGSGRSPDVADAADGADDISAHPDYPVSGSAFSTEGNLDAVRPEERSAFGASSRRRRADSWATGRYRLSDWRVQR
jgi:hypothetical protein